MRVVILYDLELGEIPSSSFIQAWGLSPSSQSIYRKEHKIFLNLTDYDAIGEDRGALGKFLFREKGSNEGEENLY